MIWIEPSERRSGWAYRRDAVLERPEVGDFPRLRVPLEKVQVDLRILELGIVLDARRPSERQPCALDTLTQISAQPVARARAARPGRVSAARGRRPKAARRARSH